MPEPFLIINLSLRVPTVAQQDQQCLWSAGMQVRIPAQHSGLRIWRCCTCSVGCNCGSHLIPDPGTLYASGDPRKKKKEKNIQGGAKGLWPRGKGDASRCGGTQQGRSSPGTDLSDLSGYKPPQTNKSLLSQIKMKDGCSQVVQQVKDPPLSLLWLRSLLVTAAVARI